MGKKNQRKPTLQLDKPISKSKSVEPTKDDQTPSTSQSDNGKERKKSTDKDSTENNPGGESPDPNCAICLGKLENKSFTDSCFHTFCFVCLLEWSKVQAVCPLCKQPFKSIIHNVRSNKEYDQYHLKPTERGHFENDRGARFRYRTTVVDRATRNWLRMRRETTENDVDSLQRPSRYTTRHQWRRRRQAATSAFRRRVYSENLQVRRLNTDSRYRDTTPAFFSGNPAQTHRLVPWLNRELNVLLSHHEDHVNFVLELILDLIKRFDIHSEEFRQHILPFTGRRTEHFIHEFYNFARAPFDIVAYDQVAVYDESQAQAQVHTIESSSSENEDNPNDPDIVILTPPEGFNPPPPSGAIIPPVDHNYSWGNLALPFGFREPVAPRNMGPFGLDLTPLLDRVRSFLNTTDSAAPSHTSWDSPTPGTSSAIWSPPQPTSPDEIEILSTPSPSRHNAGGSDSQNQRSESSRTADSTSDTSSSAGSDIEIVGYEKPFEDRTPIKVSSDEEIIIDSSPYFGRKDKKKRRKEKTKNSRWDEGPRWRERSKSDNCKHKSRSMSRERPCHCQRSESSRAKEVSSSNDQYKKDRNRHKDDRTKRKDKHRSEVKTRRDFITRSRSRSPIVRSEVLVISHSQKSTHDNKHERKERASRDLIASHVQALKDYTESRRRSKSKSKEDRQEYERKSGSHKRKHSRSRSIEFIRESHREKSRHRSKKHKKSKKHHKEKDKSSKRYRHSSDDIEVLEVRKTSHSCRSSSENSSHHSSYKKHHTGHKKSSKYSASSSTSGTNTESDRREKIIDLASTGSQSSSCSSSTSGQKPLADAKNENEKKGDKLQSIVNHLKQKSKKSKRSRNDSITEVLPARPQLGNCNNGSKRELEEDQFQNNREKNRANKNVSEDVIETEIQSLLKRHEVSSSNSDDFEDESKTLDIFALESPLDIPLPLFPASQISDMVEQSLDENIAPGNSELKNISSNEIDQNDKSVEEIISLDNTELEKKSTEELNQNVETAEENISDTLVTSNEQKLENNHIDDIPEKKDPKTEKTELQNVALTSSNPETGAIVASSTSFMFSDTCNDVVAEDIGSGMQQCDKNIVRETDNLIKLSETLQNDTENVIFPEKAQTSGASIDETPDIPLDVTPKTSLDINEHLETSEECDKIKKSAKNECPTSIDCETKNSQLQDGDMSGLVTENILGIDMTANELQILETSLRQKLISRVNVNEVGEETES